ncbi:hypothetical protein [Streptomyces sp. NBC_00878]|uniref:hypothetical protein n=1 Tax=Streptomyces sp. NBC_00878 TaxID=2975854 RepID=UPI0022583472|nr:hypothetical protein [Streptomyces sp. NBC_00878]MCX4909893.1 hypothetical protein [Streptomyces sp. NBC_00878]
MSPSISIAKFVVCVRGHVMDDRVVLEPGPAELRHLLSSLLGDAAERRDPADPAEEDNKPAEGDNGEWNRSLGTRELGAPAAS